MASVTVTYIDGTEPDEINIITADRVRYDMFRHRNKWPAFSEAPFLGLAYWAWAAATRLGLTKTDFDTWLETVGDIENVNEDEALPDPTSGAVNPAS